MDFVKKYVHLARSIKPKLTDGATSFISDVYAEIRSFDTSKTERERVIFLLMVKFIGFRQCR